MNRLQDSVTSVGTSSASSADANRMSCFVDECSFLNLSFFFSSLSRLCSNWRVRSSFWVFASSDWREMLAVSCWRIASFVVGAVPGAKIGGGPGGRTGRGPGLGWKFAGTMHRAWRSRWKVSREGSARSRW